MRKPHFLRSLLVTLVLGVCTCAQASLTIRGTRFFYHEGDTETTISFRNLNDYPVLVQAWLDDGDERADPGTVAVPFILNPAVARVEAHEGQTIRVLGTGGNFPPDRETLFWFNLLEVPPVPTERVAAGDNYLQIAGRARMKFFYRPRGLTIPPERAHDHLHFSPAPAANDGRAQIRVRNASPYHITFAKLGVRLTGQDAALLAQFNTTIPQARMVAPHSELHLPLEGQASIFTNNDNLEIVFGVINDYGGMTEGTGALYAQP